MPLDEVFHRDRHLLFYSTGVVYMARDIKELSARVPLSPKAQEPRAPTATDGGCHGYSLHIGNSSRATKHTFERARGVMRTFQDYIWEAISRSVVCSDHKFNKINYYSVFYPNEMLPYLCVLVL